MNLKSHNCLFSFCDIFTRKPYLLLCSNLKIKLENITFRQHMEYEYESSLMDISYQVINVKFIRNIVVRIDELDEGCLSLNYFI